MMKEQHRPFPGLPAEKSKAAENDLRLISSPAVKSAGRGPKVTMKLPWNQHQRRNYRQELQKDIFHDSEMKHTYPKTWKTIELKSQGIASV